MSLIKQLIPTSTKFTPASADVNWEHVNSLVYGNWNESSSNEMNSAVFSCLMAISNAFPEPPLRVYKQRGDKTVREQQGSPLQDLLDRPTPNGELTMEDILFWTAWAKHIDGNAYWLKIRSGNAETGNVVQLWPISPTLITPVSENGEWISYYKYQYKPSEFVRVPVENIIHFRLGVDNNDMRLGLSPLKALVRQISTDTEADTFVSTLLKNYAIPGLVVNPTEGNTIDEDTADMITRKLRRKFGGDNRGNIAVMGRETKIEQFGFSPKDLDMSILHRIPEERISAVLGVPAIVAGLGAGLDRATYSNFREAREMFTESKLIPQWRVDQRKLNISLTPDFTSNPNIFVEFDLTDVRALQEDEDSKYTRLESAVGKPWITRNEAREDTGYDAIEGWDDEDIAKPEPTPPQLQPFTGQPPEEEEQPPSKELAIELRTWKRLAMRAVKNQKSPNIEFMTAIIPEKLYRSIAAALKEAKSEEDVTRAFEASVTPPAQGDGLISVLRDMVRAIDAAK